MDDDESGVLELDEFLILLIKAACSRLQAVHSRFHPFRYDTVFGVRTHLSRTAAKPGGFGNQEEEGASTVGNIKSASCSRKASDARVRAMCQVGPEQNPASQLRQEGWSAAFRKQSRICIFVLLRLCLSRALGELKKVGYDCAALREACQESLCRVSHKSKCL